MIEKVKNYLPIIGLEIHVELKTKTKMFCGCQADYFGQEPNTRTCPVCLGLPGSLPVPNKKAVEWCLLIGKALNCHFNELSYFERKNYFYPDLPKGYQISQYKKPFCINGDFMSIRINRVHMEEDTAKITKTLIDFNRSGVPLVEIVTEPDFKDIEIVTSFAKKIQQIIRYLEVSDADMEKGTMRIEPSISLTASYELPLPAYRVEIKNINSFKFVKMALEYEIKRQTGILNSGGKITQETRGWNEEKQETVSQREKEEAHDYRYFPEPDIPPIQSPISNLQSLLPELPEEKKKRFMKEYGLNDYRAELLTTEKPVADYYETAVKELPKESIVIANLIINKRVDISQKIPEELINDLKNKQSQNSLSDTETETIINKVLTDNPQPVADYRAGKTGVIMYLVGQVMKESQGKANPQKIKELIEKNL